MILKKKYHIQNPTTACVAKHAKHVRTRTTNEIDIATQLYYLSIQYLRRLDWIGLDRTTVYVKSVPTINPINQSIPFPYLTPFPST